VAAHLTNKQHSQPQKVANSVREEVEQWQGVVTYPSGFEVPSFVTEPVQELPLFDDGWQCRLDQCAYITRETKALKKHWRIEHGWSEQQGRGGSGPAKQEAAQRRFEEASKRVKCQRFFRSRAHSQYFEVRGAKDDPDTTENSRDGAEIWEMAWEAASASYEQKKKCDIIRPGESDEVNPWLRRTGWVPYSTGCPQNDLLATVRKPDEQVDGQNEAIAAVIWNAVGNVAAIAESGVRRSGVMLRFEAIRTEINQVRYAPLEPYRDSDRVHKECQPWQQMVTFFVRTQQDNTWQTPPYRFNNRQKIAFQRLMAAARQEVARRDSEGDGDSGSGSDEDDNSEDDMEMDSQAKTDDKAESDTISGGTKTVQLAALDFCIELLNQTMQQHETEMALVCVLAVLGVRPTGKGFRDDEVFPSIFYTTMRFTSVFETLGALFAVVASTQQYAGEVIDTKLPIVPGAEIAFFKIPGVTDGTKPKAANLTLINYYSHGSNDKRLVESKVQRAVIIVHGLNRDPGTYQANMQSALAQFTGDSNINKDSVAILAPYFPNGDDKDTGGYPWNATLKAGGARSYTSAMVWKGSQWSAGGNNQYPYLSTSTSSYTVLDTLVQYFDNKSLFPNMKQIIVAGHSLGAQTVHR
jgi:hypothetical protein